MDHGFGLPAPLSFDASPESIFAQDRRDDADDRSRSVTDRSRFWPDDASPAYDRMVQLDFSGELRWVTVSVRNNRVVSCLLHTSDNDTFLGTPLNGHFSTDDAVRFPEEGVSITPLYHGRTCDICWRDLRFWKDVTDGSAGTRQYVPFAERIDRDDVVCVDRRTGELWWVDPYETPAFQRSDRDRFASFDDWLRMAVDDVIERQMEEEASLRQKPTP